MIGRVRSGRLLKRSVGREGEISRAGEADSAATSAQPGRRLTRLTFKPRRNIDVRYRSPLHFLELWSITGALSCWARVHDYRLSAAADRDNLLACIFQENIPRGPFSTFLTHSNFPRYSTACPTGELPNFERPYRWILRVGDFEPAPKFQRLSRLCHTLFDIVVSICIKLFATGWEDRGVPLNGRLERQP